MPGDISDRIAITPGVCGGRPRVAGTRIRVKDVALLHERFGRTPDEIVAAYPQLSLADVHTALAYYFDHRDEVRRMTAEDDAFAADLKAKTPSRLVGSGRDPVSPG